MNEVVNYHTATAEQTAIIVNRGRKLMGILMVESIGIVYRKVPLTEERHMRPLTRFNKDYPVKTALNKYLGIASRLGATKSARKAMRELKGAL